jgi:hypothetical protein
MQHYHRYDLASYPYDLTGEVFIEYRGGEAGSPVHSRFLRDLGTMPIF